MEASVLSNLIRFRSGYILTTSPPNVLGHVTSPGRPRPRPPLLTSHQIRVGNSDTSGDLFSRHLGETYLNMFINRNVSYTFYHLFMVQLVTGHRRMVASCLTFLF